MQLYFKDLGQHLDFGPVFGAPFIRGFADEGIPGGLLFELCGGSLIRAVPAFKTVTLHPHRGNVPLDVHGRPRYPMSRYVHWNPWKGHLVNAFGLSNPGLKDCIGQWESLPGRFVITLTSILETRDRRAEEVSRMGDMLFRAKPRFRGNFFVVYNVGCPNEGPYRDMGSEELAREIVTVAAALRQIGVPLVLNCSPVMPVEVFTWEVRQAYDAFWVANTIPVGHPCLDWARIFRNGRSPLQSVWKLKPAGGYSGPAALPVTLRTIKAMRTLGITHQIVAGNGIRSREDVHRLAEAGATDIAIGSVTLSRPWRTASIIEEAFTVFEHVSRPAPFA